MSKLPQNIRPRFFRGPILVMLLFVLFLAITSAGLSQNATVVYDVVSVQSGYWSDPQTWNTNRIPAPGENIKIDSAHTVIYDMQSTGAIRVIHIRGKLEFSRSTNTTLQVGLIVLSRKKEVDLSQVCVTNLQGGPADIRPTLEIGTMDQPIPAAVTSKIILTYFSDMDDDCAPAVIAGYGCRMDIHGSPLNYTWVKLSEPAAAGATQITVAEPVNWAPGDHIVITGSRTPDDGKGSYADLGDDPLPISEENYVAGISGTVLSLTTPLQYDHTAETEFKVEVANLSRNVIIESADPQGVRGHTMYHYGSNGSISYAEFAHLGKENKLARYPIHFHMLRSTNRGGSVIGASIWDSANRWITVHGTDYMVVRDCVGFQSVGHGFFMEDGSEVFNLFDNNLAIHAYMFNPLPNQAVPYDDNLGAGFWWASGWNAFANNVAVECDRYGFLFDSRSSIIRPILQPDGSTMQNVQANTLPQILFKDNETHGIIQYGFWMNGEAPPNSPTIVENFVTWRNRYSFGIDGNNYYVKSFSGWNNTYGFRALDATNCRVENMSVREMGKKQSSINFLKRAEGIATFENVTIDSAGEYPFRFNAEKSTNPLEIHIRNYTVSRIRYNYIGASVGRATKSSPDLTLYLYDWFGPNQAAKVIPANQTRNDGLTYVSMYPIFNDDVIVAQTTNPPFPQSPIQPIDNLPPATVITYPANGQAFPADQSEIVVKGTAIDASAITSLTVNGVAAVPVKDNYLQWEATLTNIGPGELTIVTSAEDEFGNVEMNPAMVTVGLGVVPTAIPNADEPTRQIQGFNLIGNYPNPFNGETNIKFSIKNDTGVPAKVQLAIYDLFGRKIRILTNQNLSTGEYVVRWDGKDEFGNQMASGIYFYELVSETATESKAYRETKKMVLVQ